MFTDAERVILSDIKGAISNILSEFTIPVKEDEMYLIFDLYEYIDKTMCKCGKKRKTATDILNEDKDDFMQQIVDYTVELEQSNVKEIKDVVNLLGKLIEGEN